MIKAGTLRAVIEIQSRSDAQDDAGQPLNTWTTWAKQHAQIIGVSGNESFRGMQLNPEMTHQVMTRWVEVPKRITDLDRLLTDDGMILDIISADYPERRTELIKLTCKQRISQGGDLDVG